MGTARAKGRADERAPNGATRPGAPLAAPPGPERPPAERHAAPPSFDAEPRALAILAAARHVVAPTTLFTALLYYFGWVYTNARALYFGLDPSALGFSTQDYLLRSIEPVFFPLSVLLIVALVLLAAHRALWSWAGKAGKQARPRAPAVVTVLTAAGLLVFVVGASGWVGRPLLGTHFLVTRLGLGLGPAIVFYAMRFRRRFVARPDSVTQPDDDRTTSAAFALVMLLLTIGLFGAVDDWAEAIGRERARQAAANLAARPGVVVFSRERLQIGGPGIEVKELAGEESAYRFRYHGLRLLVRSDGKYFLLPDGWTRTSGRALILPDSKELRYEFHPS